MNVQLSYVKQPCHGGTICQG